MTWPELRMRGAGIYEDGDRYAVVIKTSHAVKYSSL